MFDLHDVIYSSHLDVSGTGETPSGQIPKRLCLLPQEKRAGTMRDEKNGRVIGRRRVYAVDVGSTLQDRFAWARVDPEEPEEIVGSSSIELLSEWLIADLQKCHSVALGFEAPLFIPVPAGASRLSKGRVGEGNRPWSAPPGLAVTSLGLHQAAWILRSVSEHCGKSVSFEVASSAWPPGSDTTIVFCWEAFVSGPAHSPSHTRDAATAARAFVNDELRLADATKVTAEHPLSLIGAAALWSGLAVGSEVLRTPTVVLRPDRPFQGSIADAAKSDQKA